MALTTLEAATITRACQVARKLLEEVKPILDGGNIVYNSSGGASSTITQANLDAAPGLSGLTKSQLDDGMFALTSSVKGAIDAAYTALAQLAARA